MKYIFLDLYLNIIRCEYNVAPELGCQLRASNHLTAPKGTCPGSSSEGRDKIDFPRLWYVTFTQDVRLKKGKMIPRSEHELILTMRIKLVRISLHKNYARAFIAKECVLYVWDNMLCLFREWRMYTDYIYVCVCKHTWVKSYKYTCVDMYICVCVSVFVDVDREINIHIDR